MHPLELLLRATLRYAKSETDQRRSQWQRCYTPTRLRNNEGMTGVLRRWRTAYPDKRVRVNITEEQARESIERQLRAIVAREGTRATVDKVTMPITTRNANYLLR